MTKNINLEEMKQKDSEMVKGQHLKKIQFSSMYGEFGNNEQKDSEMVDGQHLKKIQFSSMYGEFGNNEQGK